MGMPKISRHRNYRKTYRTPSRAFEKERLDQELKLLGEYGLRCKREIWRVQFALSKIRKAARELLTLDAKDPKRIFEGEALLRRLKRYGLLAEEEEELDFVLEMNIQKLLERRLQTFVFKQGYAKSIHQARVLIKQRHIRVGRQLVDFAFTSPFGSGRPGRVKRRNQKSGGDKDDEESSHWMWRLRTRLTMSKPRFRIRRAFHKTSSV